MMNSLTSPRLARFRAFLPVCILALCAGATHAHPGHSGHEGGGIGWGLAHPFTGLDHLLAMIAVGLWAVQLGGRARWVLPVSFVTAMAGGAALGMAGIALPAVEPLVLASVLALGALIALAVRMPVSAGAVLVAVCAFFHGQAHGAELPGNASGWLTAAGFLTATAALHALGIFGGLALQRLAKTGALRVAGAAIALGAILLASGVL